MSADGIMYEKVVINDDYSVNMMIQFLSDNGVRLAEVYVKTEPAGETHSHQYSCDDGFAGGYGWGGSSSNYGGGTSAGGYGWGGTSSNYGGGSSEGGVGWDEYPQHAETAVDIVQPDGDQWPAWGPEWFDIENTLRSGRTSHGQEDDVGYAGNDDHPKSSYPFTSSDDESEEDLRSVSEEEDTDDIDDREVAFRQAATPYYTEVPDQFLYGQNDAPDFRPMPVYNPTANLEVGMAFISKADVQDAFSEEAMRRNFEWKVKYYDTKQLHVICKNAGEGCMWQLRAAYMKRKGVWVMQTVDNNHRCSSTILSQGHRQLKAKKVARAIKHLIEAQPDIKIKAIMAEVKDRHSYTIRYKKAWHGKQKAMVEVYGGWDDSYALLPSLMSAM
ncbi:unnamed protein product [Linum trigynum]|uniref:Transposase MuDR plant domain-containing protein n=1 Tax=Linum trigynum TaxID=586398 RepID=A0AAV2FX85_9ROSI